RTWVSLAFVVVFLTLPWIKVHGDPLFLFNILERRFIIFGVLFTPQDFVLFGLIMITFLLFSILFTIVYGRLFCGWICPQTVFMEMIFRKIEYWIEGDYKQQQQLDAAPWTSETIRKKTIKHVVFFAIAFIVANYFLAYIIGMDEVVKIMTEPVSKHTGGFMAMLVFSGAFYMVYSRLREQVCTTICPYGRMQGVLLVKDSIVVAYDHVRGEPRGKLKKGASTGPSAKEVNAVQEVVATPVKKESGEPHECACEDCDGDGRCKGNKALHELGKVNPEPVIEVKKQGDCIDCKLCIVVCPTGIDIRNGTQLECVNCTACMDACDEVMDKINRPKGLIRYDSITGIEQRRHSVFTTRVKAYSVVLLALIALDITLLFNRTPVETIILRSPGQLYQEVDANHISNLYTYQVINKTSGDLPIKLQLVTPGAELKFVATEPVSVKKDSLTQGAFFIQMENTSLKGRKTPVKIQVRSGDKLIEEITTNFLGPN
ncbi:MAG: 4Fe-4S binding protein, partial [Saprospiraceae bacterium]|nr:4Fe-4S binding protein [Saprospiraceae bacterium]